MLKDLGIHNQSYCFKMKNKVSGLLKQIITMLTTMAKAKTMALKSKTRALKTRLIIFSLLRNKKILITSISHKFNALMGQTQNKYQDPGEHTRGIELHAPIPVEQEDDHNNDKYPDLTHSMFDSEDAEFEDAGGSVIDMVKTSKEEKGEEFRLEDEIDRVADLFIRRFHRQMLMQKQLSFNRSRDMVDSTP